MKSVDTFRTAKIIKIGSTSYTFYSLRLLEQSTGVKLTYLPISLKILLENLLRREDGRIVRKEDIESLVRWESKSKSEKEIAFMPARVLLQDFTGVPCIIDLAVMRDAMIKMGGDPNKINPLQPVDLVIDHSVQVDEFGSSVAFQNNARLEFERNRERYAFLRWGQQAFKNFRVVPPDTGIVHQINLEYLAQVVFSSQNDNENLLYPDTLVGTDSHTTMINGLGVLGWGVGGIEAEAAMLGQPISMLIPQVVGFKLTGKLPPGSTATDLVLTITQQLRKKGVVGKFVEFFGPGLTSLSLADRATIANMAPEYGATMGFFPVDNETINFLRLTGRSEEQVHLVETYLKEQGMFHTTEMPEPEFSEIVELNLSSIEPSIAGPKRPQDRISLLKSKTSFRASLIESFENKINPAQKAAISDWVYYLDDSKKPDFIKGAPVEIDGQQYTLDHGAVVIAAITSCTNTSNPSVLITAGLLAKKAVELGLKSKPWVKTSLAPGSQVVTEYLREAHVLDSLEELGFHVVGYGCMTCIGNSGPLPEVITKTIKENELVAVSVLSGNRNFEGRVHPNTRANYLASPPLVVAYALAGTMDFDFRRTPLGNGKNGDPVFLKDIWPSTQEVETLLLQCVKAEMFHAKYANVFDGEEAWKNLTIPSGAQFPWENTSTYIKAAPFFENFSEDPKPLQDIRDARVLALLGDSITTDHISPAGSFGEDTPAGKLLLSFNIEKKDFNQYGTRRGNHEIMMRGTFANIRLKNQLLPGIEGGLTLHPSSQDPISIYDAAMKYKDEGVPLVIIAGKEYGSGSSRDWAAKGPALLGVRAVIAESYERIHRSNLIGMGILPLQFDNNQNRASLNLTGFESFDIEGIATNLKPGKRIAVTAISQDGSKKSFNVICRIDTPNEVDYYRHGGILQYVVRSLLNPAKIIAEQQKAPSPIANSAAKSGQTTNVKQTYRILFKGEIDPGENLQTVKERLAQLFKASPVQIERLFTGKPVTINTNLEHSAAQEYIAEMKKAGALCYFEPMKVNPPLPMGTPIKKGPQTVSTKSVKPVSSQSPRPQGSSGTKFNNSASNIWSQTIGPVLSAIGMLMLLGFYVFIILYILIKLSDHIIDNTVLFDNNPFFTALIFYAIPLLFGIFLIATMLKPLIARSASKKFSAVLNKKREQSLYTFIEKICQSIGAKVPNAIEVDCSVRASAKFRRGVIGFLEDDLILTLGLPIASESSLAEFTSLVAHEFGHSTEKLHMRLYYIITGVRDWFFRKIYEEDIFDQKISIAATVAGGFFRIFILPIVMSSFWLARRILMVFLWAGNAISGYYIRRMEFESDKCAVRLAGAEALESSLTKLQSLNVSVTEAYAELKKKKKPSDDSLPDDFISLVSSIAQHNIDPEIARAKGTALKNLTGIPEKNPTDRERIEKSKTLPESTATPIEGQTSSLFVNFSETSKLMSLRLYKEILGLHVDQNALVPTNEFFVPAEQKPDMKVEPDENDLSFFA